MKFFEVDKFLNDTAKIRTVAEKATCDLIEDAPWFGLKNRKKISQIINTTFTFILCSHLMIIKSSETNNKANN